MMGLLEKGQTLEKFSQSSEILKQSNFAYKQSPWQTKLRLHGGVLPVAADHQGFSLLLREQPKKVSLGGQHELEFCQMCLHPAD